MQELSSVKGVGPVRLNALRAMGITSLRDLLYFLPIDYHDYSCSEHCGDVEDGMRTVAGVLQSVSGTSWFHGLSKVSAVLSDKSGRLNMVWFNQPWVAKQLSVGQKAIFFGHVVTKNGRRQMVNGRVVTESGLVPVYRPIPGFPAKTFRALVQLALDDLDELCEETLPETLLKRWRLIGLREAIREAHAPESTELLALARRRIDFEKMLRFQLLVLSSGEKRDPAKAISTKAEDEEIWWQGVPFPATNAQKRVLNEIRGDLTGNVSMRRLVQGDVGCGKTIIAFGAIFLVCMDGHQCAMMAPTDILARQHYESARRMLEPRGIRCGLLTGKMTAKEKKEARNKLASGEWQAVFGTHALISADVEYHDLALTITDEQHRFGVRQRSELRNKGASATEVPHVLVMSATPIPRSLALILYGDLDLSIVDELPSGRVPVKTRIVPEPKRKDMYAFLQNEVQSGRQVYIVCPLVEDSDTTEDGICSVHSMYAALKSGPLKSLRIGEVWGTQAQAEKQATLEAFRTGQLDLLVSTTVIEVGINVPNATIMVIENADRFGLSQLHQLRGRVGRGDLQSWCFLMGKPNERLKTMTGTGDGFEIAQKDLELRGPGDLFGTRQSGELIPGVVLTRNNIALLEESTRCARELKEDPELRGEYQLVLQSTVQMQEFICEVN